MTRRPSNINFSSRKRTAESPPRRNVSIYIPCTVVCHWPIEIPRLSVTGCPSRIRATSVVVPPISTITASLSPARTLPPIALAAGPERRVSTGTSLVMTSDIRLPSLLTMAIGISRSLSLRTFFTASRNCAISGTSLAFSSVPAPLRRTSTSSNSSYAVVTEKCMVSLIISAALFSRLPPSACGNTCVTPTAPQS